MKSVYNYNTHAEKINYLRHKLKGTKVKNDTGLTAVSTLLGLKRSTLQKRLANKVYRYEFDLAADALIERLHETDRLDKFTHVMS